MQRAVNGGTGGFHRHHLFGLGNGWLIAFRHRVNHDPTARINPLLPGPFPVSAIGVRKPHGTVKVAAGISSFNPVNAFRRSPIPNFGLVAYWVSSQGNPEPFQDQKLYSV